MLIYVQGSDSFLAKKAIDQIKAKYLAKNPTGGELIEIDGAGQSPNWADLQAVPLFATSRLVIIRQAGLLNADSQRTLAGFAAALPSTTVAIIWDGKKPGTDLASTLAAATKIIAAEPSSEAATRRFIQAKATELGLKLDSQGLNQLLERAGNDLWFIESELVYLATAGASESVGQGRSSDEPFIYFQLIRQKAWAKIGSQLIADYRRGKPFELLLGSLAAAVRKENRSSQKVALVDLMADIDFGTKTGLLDPSEAIALLAYHLPNPDRERVQWEQLYYETY